MGGTSFSGWEEGVPPRLVPSGVGFLPQGTFLPATSALDAGYCTTEPTHLPVTPGQRLKFEAEYEIGGLLGGTGRAKIAVIEASLRRAGVPILHSVGSAPLTGVPFQRGQTRFAFVPPETDGSGTAQVGGKRCTVASTGTLVPLTEED